MKTIVSSLRHCAALFLFLCLFVASGTMQAADSNPPDRLTYQGYLVDGNGSALATNAPKNYDVVFRIYDSQSGGTLKWSEQQTLTVDKGYFSVLLGEGSQVGSEPHASLATIFYAIDASDRYVGITVKGVGASGTDVDILPRLRMLTAPYAYLARNAINASSLANSTNNQIVTVQGINVGINKPTPGSALDVNGIVTATAFSGNGASLTALNANNIASGTLADARLTANVGLLNGSQTWSGRPVFNNGINMASTLIYLRGANDGNHSLRHQGTGFGGYSLDGPVLQGWAGGTLGSSGNGGDMANLLWNATGVTINGQVANNANANTAYGLAQQLTIQAKDIGPSNIRLTAGMCQVNNVEYAGVVQAYSSASGVANLRLNPLGGSTFIGSGLTVGGGLSANGGISVGGNINIASGGVNTSGGGFNFNSGAVGGVFSTMKAMSGQGYILWLYDQNGGLNYSFGDNGNALKSGSASWGTLSDARLKTNVQNLTGALANLLALRSVTFEFKDPKKHGTGLQRGFIAQEVEKVFPEWVNEGPEGMKSVTLRGFESVTVQAIRELKGEKDAQVTKLEEENKALRAQVESQEKRISKLEKLQALLEEISKDKAAGN